MQGYPGLQSCHERRIILLHCDSQRPVFDSDGIRETAQLGIAPAQQVEQSDFTSS